MIHHCKALDLEIVDFENNHDWARWSELTPSQTSKYAMRDGVEHPTSFVEASQKGEAQRAEQ